ncbi:MAG: hypothetical protein WC876_08200 [Candidatus Thermoplasmatota archaeon]
MNPGTQTASSHGFAVIACSSCRKPWAVELRHATASCPDCRTSYIIAERKPLWQGDDARAAQAAVAHHRAAMAGGLGDVQSLKPKRPEPKHDSPADAAAAQAAGIVNLSARAEAVALWMTRLLGQVPHVQLLEAMAKAGIDRSRADREVIRLLATDLMMEPKAGHYRVLDA